MTTIKTTNELKAGDIVRAHGGRFKLTTCSKFACASNRDTLPPHPVYAWKTECIEASPVIRADWLPWIIQGNHMAFWSVE